MKCLWLDHRNPFLKIGPFKYEQLHENFEIGIVHELITVQESLAIRKLSKGKMKSTPYVTANKETVYSKVSKHLISLLKFKMIILVHCRIELQK